MPRTLTAKRRLFLFFTSLPFFLCSKTGVLEFGRRDSVQPIAESLKAVGNVTYEVMSGKEANQRYPMQLQLPNEYGAIFEGDGGILKANKALAAMQVCVFVCVYVLYVCVCLRVWMLIGIGCLCECPNLAISAGYILFQPALEALCQPWRGVVGPAQGD